MTDSPAAALLARLDRVRQTAPSQWVARCPAHADKGPSLTVKELPDGRVLFHCFAGCEGDDVLAAIGLRWLDIYPPRPPDERAAPGDLTHWDARTLLMASASELRIAYLIVKRAAAMADQDARARLLMAARRIGEAAEAATSGKQRQNAKAPTKTPTKGHK